MSTDQIGPSLGDVIPDTVEPIKGYRVWSWDEGGLYSYNGTRWTPGEYAEASCKGGLNYNPSSITIEKWIKAATREELALVLSTAYETDEDVDDVIVDKFDLTIEKHPRAADDHSCPSDPTDTEFHGTHGCGLYAYSTIEACWEDRRPKGGLFDFGVMFGNSFSGTIFGEVELWGRVWPHAKGYRASHMRPTAFYRDPTGKVKPTFMGHPIEKLAEMYGVELRDFPIEPTLPSPRGLSELILPGSSSVLSSMPTTITVTGSST